MAEVSRYPDSTPNMYGFDSWDSTYDNETLGDLFSTSSSNNLYIYANSKVTWNTVWEGNVSGDSIPKGQTVTITLSLGSSPLNTSKPILGHFAVAGRGGDIYLGKKWTSSDDDYVIFNSFTSSSVNITVHNGATLLSRIPYVRKLYQP